MSHDVLVWMAQNPAVWGPILGGILGFLCSLAYRALQRYSAWRAFFKLVAAAMPADVSRMRDALLELAEAVVARKAGIPPVPVRPKQPTVTVTPPAEVEAVREPVPRPPVVPRIDEGEP